MLQQWPKHSSCTHTWTCPERKSAHIDDIKPPLILPNKNNTFKHFILLTTQHPDHQRDITLQQMVLNFCYAYYTTYKDYANFARTNQKNLHKQITNMDLFFWTQYSDLALTGQLYIF